MMSPEYWLEQIAGELKRIADLMEQNRVNAKTYHLDLLGDSYFHAAHPRRDADPDDIAAELEAAAQQKREGP